MHEGGAAIDMRRLNLRGILIDLNGTIHLGSKPTARAVEALQRLRDARFPFVFCSNSTKESTQSLLGHLRGMGFEVRDRELMTSLGACRALVEQRKLRPFLLLSDSAREEFASSSQPDQAEKGFDSVILGLDPPSLSYDRLNTAFRILKNEPISKTASTCSTLSIDRSISLIAPHASLFQQSPETDDLPAGLSLGIGPFVKALEEASGIQAELVGKPTKRFFELAVERMESLYGDTEGEIGIIGDDVKNDLGDGARQLGLKRFLVKTGKYRDGVEEGQGLDGVFDDFATFVDDLLMH